MKNTLINTALIFGLLFMVSCGDTQDKLVEGKFKLNAMKCHLCVSSVRSTVMEIDGVSSSEPDFKTGEVKVTYDPKKTDLESIKKKIQETGFADHEHPKM